MFRFGRYLHTITNILHWIIWFPYRKYRDMFLSEEREFCGGPADGVVMFVDEEDVTLVVPTITVIKHEYKLGSDGKMHYQGIIREET